MWRGSSFRDLLRRSTPRRDIRNLFSLAATSSFVAFLALLPRLSRRRVSAVLTWALPLGRTLLFALGAEVSPSSAFSFHRLIPLPFGGRLALLTSLITQDRSTTGTLGNASGITGCGPSTLRGLISHEITEIGRPQICQIRINLVDAALNLALEEVLARIIPVAMA